MTKQLSVNEIVAYENFNWREQGAHKYVHASDYAALEARCREQQDELTLLKRDRNSLIEMTGLTIVEVAKRLNRLRSSKETK